MPRPEWLRELSLTEGNLAGGNLTGDKKKGPDRKIRPFSFADPPERDGLPGAGRLFTAAPTALTPLPRASGRRW
jgi:hypothetical protein